MRRLFLPIFVILTQLSSASADSYSFDFKTIQAAYERIKQLATFPGNMSSVSYDLINKSLSYSRLADLPSEALNSYRTSAPLETSAAPSWMQDYLRKVEIFVFGKTDIIKIRLSDATTTQMFYEDNVIVIQKSDLKRPTRQLKFIIAHEFAHFILYSYQMSSQDGLSPSGFSGIKLWHPDVENLAEALPIDYYLDHAEVDVMACLLMQKLREPVTTDFLTDLLTRKETALDGKPLPLLVVKELEVRLKALISCRDQKN